MALVSPVVSAVADIQPVVVDVLVDSVRRPSSTFTTLLALQPGDPFSADAADSDLKRLYATGAFDDVRLEVEEREGGVRLVYRCLDRTFLAGLRFTDQLFSAQALRNVVGMEVGSAFDPTEVAPATEALRSFFASEGFPDVEVTAEVAKEPSSRTVLITFHIERGKALRIASRRLTGSTGVAPWRLRRKMEMRLFDRLRPAIFEAERRRLLDYLRGLGFLSAQVGLPETHADRGSHWVRVVTSVEAGIRTRFKVRGNRALSNREVITAMAITAHAELEGEERTKKMAEGVVNAYRREGYDEATVEMVPPSGSPDRGEQVVVVGVHEGKRRKVVAISIDGTGAIDAEEIRGVMALAQPRMFDRPPWFRSDLFEADRQAIIAFLQGRGHYQAVLHRYQARRRGEDIIVEVEIDEGPLATIGGIEIEGAAALTREEITMGLAIDDPLRLEEIAALRRRVLSAYRGRGFLEVRVASHLEPMGDQRWRLRLVIDEGVATTVGATRIRGLQSTHPKVVHREIGYRQGEPLSPDRLADTRRRLSRLGLFDRIDVRPDPLLAGAPVRDVVVDVDEGQAGEVGLSIGFGTEENLRTAIEISHRNPLGYNRPIAFLTQLSSIESSFSISGREPYLFGTHTALVLNLVSATREFEQFTKDTRGASAILERELTPHLFGSIGLQYENVSVSDVTDDVVITDAESGKIGIASVIGSLLWDFRDNFLNPTRGFLVGVDVQQATDVLFSERNFVKIGGQLSGVVTPWEGWTTAAGVRLGTILNPQSGEGAPIHVRYFLGGRSTIRAFSQDELDGDNPEQLGGNSFLVFNLEERFPLYQQLKGAIFTDIGNVFTDENPLRDLGDIRYSAGIGIRLTTPVGPLRLDYGRKLDRKSGERGGAFHFTLGHAF